MDSKDDFTMLRHFEHSPREVFGAFTNAEILRKWFVPENHQMIECTADAAPGGALHILTESMGERHSINGKYSIVDPYEHIAFTLSAFPLPGGGYGFESSIAITLTGDDNRTKLELRYELIHGKAEYLQAMAATREGWDKSFDRLKKALAIQN